jgi:cell division protein FtsL
MTVLSYRANHFNTYASKATWQRSGRSGIAGAKVVFLMNFLVFSAIISALVFYVFWTAQMTNARLDIQKTEKSIQTLEEKNADLKIQLNQVGASANLEKVLSSTTLAKVSRPTYFAIQKSVNSIGFNQSANGTHE